MPQTTSSDLPPERDRTFCRHHPRRKPTASNRNVAWYRRERPKWIAYLGNKCGLCGKTLEEAEAEGETLEFDHHVPRDWEPARTSRWQRLRNYIREIKEGKIRQALCRSCNGRKGYPDGQQELLDGRAQRDQNAPF